MHHTNPSAVANNPLNIRRNRVAFTLKSARCALSVRELALMLGLSQSDAIGLLAVAEVCRALEADGIVRRVEMATGEGFEFIQ